MATPGTTTWQDGPLHNAASTTLVPGVATSARSSRPRPPKGAVHGCGASSGPPAVGTSSMKTSTVAPENSGPGSGRSVKA